MPGVEWTQVVVTTAIDQAEVAGDQLWSFGCAAIEEVADGTSVVLLAGYEHRAVALAAADALRAAGWPGVAVRAVDDHGLDGWRDHARAQRAGPFLVVPSWRAVEDAEDDAIVLSIDPGHSFGSASHPTTRLVLATLPALLAATGPPTAVLDVGCGSGVLSVAAARLGAAQVTGIDIDPDAPAVTAANARRNGVATSVAASNDSLDRLASAGATYDLVLANLLAPVVTELADPITAVVAARGHLVVSGLLADRWPATIEHLPDLEVTAVTTEDGWAAITLRRRSGRPRS